MRSKPLAPISIITPALSRAWSNFSHFSTFKEEPPSPFLASSPHSLRPYRLSTTDSSAHLSPPRTLSHRRSTSRNSLAQHLILQSQLSKRMSQYGGQQQYGGAQGGQGGQGGYGGQQDPSQQDPSQSQYGAQQGQGGYDQQQQDPSQQDPSQQDPSQSQYGAQSNGYPAGGDDQADPSQQQDPSQMGQGQQQGYGQGQQMNKPSRQAMTKADPSKGGQMGKGQQGQKSGPSRKWDANHHNAMYVHSIITSQTPK